MKHAFLRESEMVSPAKDWLSGRGLTIKSEYDTPWGACDLVGCRLDTSRVRARLKLGQTKAIGSSQTIQILLAIPEEGSKAGITPKTLEERFDTAFGRECVLSAITYLAEARFIRITRRERLVRVNGWMPLHKLIVSVELKISKVAEALRQAVANKAFATHSYVGLPFGTAHSLTRTPRAAQFRSAGIGLIAVGRTNCEEVIRPSKTTHNPHAPLALHCAERFWRSTHHR